MEEIWLKTPQCTDRNAMKITTAMRSTRCNCKLYIMSADCMSRSIHSYSNFTRSRFRLDDVVAFRYCYPLLSTRTSSTLLRISSSFRSVFVFVFSYFQSCSTREPAHTFDHRQHIKRIQLKSRNISLRLFVFPFHSVGFLIHTYTLVRARDARTQITYTDKTHVEFMNAIGVEWKTKNCWLRAAFDVSGQRRRTSHMHMRKRRFNSNALNIFPFVLVRSLLLFHSFQLSLSGPSSRVDN